MKEIARRACIRMVWVAAISALVTLCAASTAFANDGADFEHAIPASMNETYTCSHDSSQPFTWYKLTLSQDEEFALYGEGSSAGAWIQLYNDQLDFRASWSMRAGQHAMFDENYHVISYESRWHYHDDNFLKAGTYYIRVGDNAGVSGHITFSFLRLASYENVTLMHRMYNMRSGEHFYTARAEEMKNLVNAGWEYEGIAWTAPKSSSVPVYRLYSGTDHHYTTSAQERDHLVSVGWSDEGVGWYSDDAKGVPLYRQFNPNVNPSASTNNSGSHNYTTSKDENNQLVSVGWQEEGIGWYGCK